MPSRRTHRSLYAYSLHGRDETGTIDYLQFFDELEHIPIVERRTQIGTDTVAVTVIERRGRPRWALRFVAGEEGLPALIYDPATGQEAYEDLGRRFAVSSSWILVNADTRYVALERRRPGVGVGTVAIALAQLGNELGITRNARFELNPVAAESFIEEIDTFERIRKAAVVVQRPNYDWTDSAAELTHYAAESDAQTAEVELAAERGGTLARATGIVNDLRQLVLERIGPLRNARLTGRRAGEEKESTVSLERHQERRYAPIPPGATVEEQNEIVVRAEEELVQDMAAERRPPEHEG